jgi:hypothetical protein
MALFGAIHASAEPSFKDVAAIRSLMSATWDKPDAKLVVEPVVVRADYAVASWVQGNRGGRALLRKNEGVWIVVLCSGDPLKDASALAAAGVPADVAAHLARELAAAERQLPAAHTALFSTFDGVVEMDQHHGHVGHH